MSKSSNANFILVENFHIHQCFLTIVQSLLFLFSFFLKYVLNYNKKKNLFIINYVIQWHFYIRIDFKCRLIFDISKILFNTSSDKKKRKFNSSLLNCHVLTFIPMFMLLNTIYY